MINLSELNTLPSFVSFSKELNEDPKVELSSDTRSYKSPEVFLAITGEKFNAVNFIGQVVDKGCNYIIYSDSDVNNKLVEAYSDKCTFIKTKDSIRFLQDFTNLIANKFKAKGGKLIGISGSNGKTTTKEMLFHVLEGLDKQTICTQKNNNNHIGVPLTLLQITGQTKFGIIELGSNHPGEIKTLCEIADPNIGVTTNIGDTHLEFFENRANVFLEEGYLYHHQKSNTCDETQFFVNEDDEFLKTYQSRKGCISYGFNGADYKFDISRNFALINNGNKTYKISNSNITGEHNFYNLCVAFMMAKEISEFSTDKLLALCESFSPTQNRSQWISHNSVDIFLDAYNANPSSMRAAINGFLSHIENAQDSCLILGDMNELGENAKRYHREIGEHLKSSSAGKVVFVGRFAEDYNAGCSGLGSSYLTVDELTDEFKKSILNNFKYVFIKGSRSLQLERLLDIK